MNHYKVTIITMGNVYTRDGRDILKDAEITIIIRGVREEDLKHFEPLTFKGEKRDKDVTGGLK